MIRLSSRCITENGFWLLIFGLCCLPMSSAAHSLSLQLCIAINLKIEKGWVHK